jgi:exodeoxyribonuclease V gamma subunit
LLQAVRTGDFPAERLPARISLFGISYLPPFHFEVVLCLAQKIPVNYFVLNPCREYWMEILTDREKNKIARKYRHLPVETNDLHLGEGNPLLASMGHLGRHFFSMVNMLECEIMEAFEEVKKNSILSCLQGDILTIENGPEPERGFGGDPRHLQKDDSFQIHSCHSALREIEVLHDHILSFLDGETDLQPKDIIVMVPDIEAYAHLITATFTSRKGSYGTIPFSIADETVLAGNQVVSTFMAVLELVETRYEAPKIIELLESDIIRNRFQLNTDHIRTIEKWVRDTNIRWGIDSDDRARRDLPAIHENTWENGIERMLLGYALPAENMSLFKAILPYDGIEGKDAIVLGKFLEYLDKLFAILNELKLDRKIEKWSEILKRLIDSLFWIEEELEGQLQILRKLIDEFNNSTEKSAYEGDLSFKAMKLHLTRLMTASVSQPGFISGGVTFCKLLPMRSIPFKIICLLGMNHDTFPRENRSIGFDLMVKKPRMGDRSKREDDRYLFLETLLSAREKLYISYIGQSIQDNSELPPSVLVDELIDYITEHYRVKPAQFLTRHKLQPFSKSYFSGEDPKLFSYSESNRVAAEVHHKNKRPSLLIPKALPVPDDRYRQLTLEALSRFFSNPCRFLLQQRLGLFLKKPGDPLKEKENFILNPLDRFILGKAIMEANPFQKDFDSLFALIKARGMLPHGNVGTAAYSELNSSMVRFVGKWESLTKDISPHSLELRINLNNFFFRDEINNIFNGVQIIGHPAPVKPKHLIKAWVYHLFFCHMTSSGDDDEHRKTILIGSDKLHRFEFVKNANEVIQKLLDSYWSGLTDPLPFFPKTSFEYARNRLLKNKSKDQSIYYAKKKWEGYTHPAHQGESIDPYFEICFKTEVPINAMFINCSEKILGPMLAHLTDEGF